MNIKFYVDEILNILKLFIFLNQQHLEHPLHLNPFNYRYFPALGAKQFLEYAVLYNGPIDVEIDVFRMSY